MSCAPLWKGPHGRRDYPVGVSLSVLLILLVLLVAGAIAQRVAGLGFAMVVSPFVVLVLGAHQGVVLVNLCGVFSSLLVIHHVWKRVRWKAFLWLIIPALVGSLPGSFLANWLPGGPLAIVVGVVVLLALGSSLVLSRRGTRIKESGPNRSVAGLFAGFTNSLSGVGGPVLTAYAELSRWQQKDFVAMLQPFFIITGAFSAATKVVADPSTMPVLDWWQWLLLAAMIVLGVQVGHRLAPKVPDQLARRIVVVLAVIGAVTAVVKGILDTVGS